MAIDFEEFLVTIESLSFWWLVMGQNHFKIKWLWLKIVNPWLQPKIIILNCYLRVGIAKIEKKWQIKDLTSCYTFAKLWAPRTVIQITGPNRTEVLFHKHFKLSNLFFFCKEGEKGQRSKGIGKEFGKYCSKMKQQ